MLGLESPPAWLQTDWLLGQFSAQRRRAAQKYEDFVRAGVGLPSVWDGLKHQVFLGSDAFVEGIQHRIPDAEKLREIPRAQRRPRAPRRWSNMRAMAVRGWRGPIFRAITLCSKSRIISAFIIRLSAEL